MEGMKTSVLPLQTGSPKASCQGRGTLRRSPQSQHEPFHIKIQIAVTEIKFHTSINRNYFTNLQVHNSNQQIKGMSSFFLQVLSQED